MAKLTKRKRLENKLDKLWRSVGKGTADCEICATLPSKDRVNYTQLHPHHIVGRRHRAVRWDLRNRLWVCPTHHTLGNKCVEHNQVGWFWNESICWMSEHRPEDRKYLDTKRHETKKWTISELEKLVEGFKDAI